MLLSLAAWLAAPANAVDVDAFVRPGCPHCAAAEVYLDTLEDQRPDVHVTTYDVVASPDARARLEALSEAHGVTTPGVPSFLVGDELIVGFVDAETTGPRLLAAIEGRAATDATGLADDVCEPEVPCLESATDAPSSVVDLPVLGRLRVDRLGLPLFTVIVGLLDGFNPCATWVLMFLLSVLVREQDRLRMVAVAGTFVVVSGVVYFAFMAAWLNVFFVLGLSRLVQATLAVLALGIGLVNLRDGLSHDGGFTLAIPDRFKPIVARRSHAVSRASSLWAAVAGVAGLAVLVNLVELLCTAGLPAVYTHVLTQHNLTRAAHYGYLALYDLAYMFDDGLMVGAAVITLSQARLQERGGRALKLLSGGLMTALALVLLFRPAWLALL